VYRGILEYEGLRLKRYEVVYGEAQFDQKRFQPGFHHALSNVASSDRNHLFGGGILIGHQGKSGDYVVVSLWSRENELLSKVFVRYDAHWLPAQHGESVCVWDLEILWFERCLYVESVLNPACRAPIRTYFSRGFHQQSDQKGK
jgi:hypothetical protein